MIRTVYADDVLAVLREDDQFTDVFFAVDVPLGDLIELAVHLAHGPHFAGLMTKPSADAIRLIPRPTTKE